MSPSVADEIARYLRAGDTDAPGLRRDSGRH